MMDDDAAVWHAINKANKALKEGDRRSARRWAEQAVFLGKGMEETWLLLARNSSPHASLVYVKEALRINPTSPAARAALVWAQQRLNDQPSNRVNPHVNASQKAVQVDGSGNPGDQRLWAGILGALAVFVWIAAVVAWLEWSGSFSTVGTLISRSIKPQSSNTGFEITPPVAAVPLLAAATVSPPPAISPTFSLPMLPTATVTPEPTHTQNPSPTITPESTHTRSPTPTATHSPSLTATRTPDPSPTPAPTTQTVYTVQPGDTLSQIAANFSCDITELIQVNHITNPAYIAIGQKLIIPQNSFTAAVAPKNLAAMVPSAAKMIMVDISSQHVYAYAGNQLVFSFVASTGEDNSTLPGHYTILDKSPDAYSDPWGFWMPDWMGIYYIGNDLENGFHALPVLSDGEQIWGNQIGTPITYGCVVLRPGDMRQLYDWADVGTAVEIK